VQKLLALAKVYGNSVIRERCGQKNAWDFVAERGTGMRVIAAFFGLCVPYELIFLILVFSNYFKRLDRFTKLATSSNGKLAGGPGFPIEAPRRHPRLESRLKGRDQGLKLVEGHAGEIQEFRWAGLQVGEP